jgi:hypothetical protein
MPKESIKTNGIRNIVCSLVCALLAAGICLAQLNSNSFSPVVSYGTGGFPAQGLAVGDVNNDGFPDIVAVNYCFSSDPQDCHTGIGVLINNGDGTFQSPLRYATDGFHGATVAIADVDGDGKSDLVVTNATYPSTTVSVMRGNGNATFQPAVSYGLSPLNPNLVPNRVIAADVNGDRKPDVLVAMGSRALEHGAISVLINRGDGTFFTPVLYDSGGYGPRDLVAIDINGDGIPDVAAVNRCGSSNCADVGFGVVPGSIGLLLGNGNGSFQPAVILPSGGYSPDALAAADLNRDGRPDLVVTQCLHPQTCSDALSLATVLQNKGNGNFEQPVSYSVGVNQNYLYFPSSIAAGDVDGDGSVDIIVLNDCNQFGMCDGTGQGGNGTVSVLLGNGDGTLKAPALFNAGGNVPIMVVVADVNGDGKPDIELTTTNTAGVLLNQTPRAPTPVTVDTTPTGLTILVDGVSATAPKMYQWAINSQHQLSATDPQQVTGGLRLVFSSWSDGGALTHTVTTPSSAITYSATFKTQYLLTTAANPPAGGSITPGDWFDSGSSVRITATPAAGYGFTGFSGDLSGTTDPNTITMNAAKTVTANFKGLTTTSLSSSLNPASAGQTVTFTSVVSSPVGVPTGTVAFKDGGALLGKGMLDSSGRASFSTADLAVGPHSITAEYGGDTKFLGSSSSTLSQMIVDTTPLSLRVTLTPSVLWPPNHRLVTITADIQVSDGTDPVPAVTLVSITSSEPDDGLGDGDTAGDIQSASIGTDDRTFQLRAERSGTGPGRVYTVVYRATDRYGNARTVTAQVFVPHSQ